MSARGRDELADASARVRPGTKLGAGAAIARLGDWGDQKPPRTAAQAVDRVAADGYFREYLRLAPKGEHVAEARGSLMERVR